jgi:hypothetical protein
MVFHQPDVYERIMTCDVVAMESPHHAPRFRRMLQQFMSECDLIQWHNLRDVESLPSRLEYFVDVPSRFDLCFGYLRFKRGKVRES